MFDSNASFFARCLKSIHSFYDNMCLLNIILLITFAVWLPLAQCQLFFTDKSDESVANLTMLSSKHKSKYDKFEARPRLRNRLLDAQNPSSVWPPNTDEPPVPTFKYPFSFAQRSIWSGGWTRQVTVRDLPISRGMAGVQMKLIKGGVRELHWHVESEWAYVIEGTCRITAVDQYGRGFVEDVSKTDLWLFPSGIPHSIQGLAPDGCFFLLVFNNGSFDEFSTFLLTDWLRHTPRDVLAKNFEVDESVFKNIPQHQLYIFASELPRPLYEEKFEVAQVTGEVYHSFAFFTTMMEPNKTTKGGEVKIVDKRNFPVTDIAAALVTLKPGGLRELHWHPNADEWQYYVQGHARMTVFAAGSRARTMDFTAGDVGYVPISQPHYIENTGDKDVIFLEVFPSAIYEDISLAEWLAHTPSRLVNEHIHTGETFVRTIEKTEVIIRPL